MAKKLWPEDNTSSAFLSESIQDLNNYGATKEWDVFCVPLDMQKRKNVKLIFYKEQCSTRRVTPLIFH